MIWDHVQPMSHDFATLDGPVFDVALEEANETARLHLSRRTNQSLRGDDCGELLPSGD